MKYSFCDDYSEGASPEIMEALNQANSNQELGYGNDSYCARAKTNIQKHLGKKADIHFLAGGTHTNLIVLQSMLAPYQGIIAPESGHIAVHEAGAIEATGRKIITIPSHDGKLTIDMIDKALLTHENEHTVMPKVVFLTNATELGTVYLIEEIKRLVDHAHKNGLYAYLDGARLAMALASTKNTLQELADTGLDMFYIGGTKVGALCGEALVILNSDLKNNFRYHLKQRGALLAKGRLFGAQFERFFEENLYFDLGVKSNQKAQMLYQGLLDLGVKFEFAPAVNQVFPILSNSAIEALEKIYGFYCWKKVDSNRSMIRLVCSWATKDEPIEMFLNDLKKILTNT